MAKRSSLNLKNYYCCDFGSFHDYSQCPYSHVRNNTPLKNVDVRQEPEIEDNSKLSETVSPELNSSEAPVEESFNVEELSSAITAVIGHCNSDLASGTSDEPIPSDAQDTEVSMLETTDLAERGFSNAAAAENRTFNPADHASNEPFCPLSKLPLTESIAVTEQSSADSYHCKTDYTSQTSEATVHPERCIPHAPVIESVNLSEKSSVDESTRHDKITNGSSTKEPIHLELHKPEVPLEDFIDESERSSTEDSSAGQRKISLAHHITDELITLTPPIQSVLDAESAAIPGQSFANAATAEQRERNESHTSKQNLEESWDDNKCGICLESMIKQIPDPAPYIYRYGILPNCKHTFCLECIRTWRCQATRNQHLEDNWSDSDEDDQPPVVIDPGVARSCPVCRILSYYVVPSACYVKDKAEKDELVSNYKEKLSETNCKYFKRGGLCKFRKSCFYLHAASYCKALRSKFEWTLQ